MTFSCNVSADLFSRALSCVADEKMRYYLRGVNIEPAPKGDEGAIMVSTDGNRMIMLRDPEGVANENAIVQVDAATIKALKGRFAERLVVAEDRVEILDRHGGVIHIQALPALIDGTFPDWRRVVPAATVKPHGGCFNARLLAPLARALSDSAKVDFYRLYGEDAGSPAIMIGTTSTDAFGVLMPARDNTKAPDRPTWACRAD